MSKATLGIMAAGDVYKRQLLYTAVTRAKKCLTIVGSDTTFQEMIQNKREQDRYTSLAESIQEF